MRRALLAVLCAAYGWVHLGFFVHRSRDPSILGLWSTKYAVVLLVLAIPYVFFPRLARFLTEPGRYRAPDGSIRVLPVRRKLLFLSIVLAALFAVAEGVVRWRFPNTKGGGQAAAYQPHAFLQHVHRPGARFKAGPIEIVYNGHGFRGPELESVKPAGQFRIFCLGGSTVAQWNVEDGLDWPSMLARRLAERHPDRSFAVENAAVSGWSSLHSLYAYETTIRHLEPDLVIVYHAVNDLVRGFTPDIHSEGEYRDDYGHFFFALQAPIDRGRRAWYVDWRRSLVLARSVDWVEGWLLSSWYTEAPALRPFDDLVPYTPDDFRSLPAFRRNMATLVRAVRADGARILIATQPTLLKDELSDTEIGALWMNLAFCHEGDRYLSPEGFTKGMRRFNDAVRDLAREEQVPFCDLEAAVPKDLGHFLDEVHPNARGLRRVAEAIYDCLEREDLLER